MLTDKTVRESAPSEMSAAMTVPVTPKKSPLTLVPWVLAWVSAGIQLLAGLLTVLSIASTDPGWSMVTALVVAPLSMLIAATIVIICAIFTITLRVRNGRGDRKWWIPLVISIAALLFFPIMITIMPYLPI